MPFWWFYKIAHLLDADRIKRSSVLARKRVDFIMSYTLLEIDISTRCLRVLCDGIGIFSTILHLKIGVSWSTKNSAIEHPPLLTMGYLELQSKLNEQRLA